MQYEGNRLRHELKFYLNYDTYHSLRNRLRVLMDKDPHMEEEDGYLISSIYFDDRYHSAMEEKIAGTKFRKKYRIRCYGRSNGRIRLECKSKYLEYISKTSADLSPEEYRLLLEGKFDFLAARPETICRELLGYHKWKGLKPVVVVEYVREAYISAPGNVRITFDKEISASIGTLDVFHPEFHTKRVLGHGLMVLEVKYDDYLPSGVRSILQAPALDRCAISKYVMCREEKRRVEKR